MPPKASRRSSTTSIISVDPAVASQIYTNPKVTLGHARTESTPAQTLNTPVATLAKGHSRTNSAPGRHVKKRSNSLRRVKNSTELLKLRSTNADRNSKKADPAAVKRGRNFTVSNVATGGLLQLSPSPHQLPFSPAVASPSAHPWMPLTAVSVLPTKPEAVPPSHPQHSRTRSVSPKRLLDRAIQSKSSKEFHRVVHNRSQSFSTLDESRRSIPATQHPKTLKIVINRPESVHSSEEEQEAAPTLEIPIPHYKLGTPRFSAHGTPFMRGSSYTRGSAVASTNHSSMTDHISGPPLSSMKVLSRLQQSQTSEQKMVPMPNPLRVLKPGTQRQSSSATSYVSPISADLYDQLLEVYDDPSVVRFGGGEKEIAAATKIRIIAQISSESFMDYDLVSDFFLTFRAYMTTFEVLDYLLARLKWSVGRLSDDGRIIRIRTFAALRHWILNYFAEDFVVNRHLRVRFCQEVNNLYESVRQRPRGVGGASDLKILQDLKRCWNGRCALYWDAEEFNMDSNQEDPLLPGGVIGSRNPAFADIGEATAALGLGLQDMPQTLPSPLPSTSSKTTKKTSHKRLPSSDYAKKPLSIESERSLHATSCSLPRYGSRSPDKDTSKPERGPQPVSVLSRRQNAPSDLKVHVQARLDNGGEPPQRSTSNDSLRGQQTPVEVLMSSGHYVDPHAGSMIRGFVYGPVEPFIQLPSNPPLSPSLRFSAGQQSASSPRVPSSPHTPSSGPHAPAVKNMFGSIRRALSGKQGSNEVTVITVSNPRPDPSQAGRRAPVPVNLARSNDDLRRKAAGVPTKTQLRIDLLCAAAVQSFQTAVPGAQAPMTADTPHAQQSFLQAPFSPPLSSTGDLRQLNLPTRLPSHSTAQSGSILIVDDTAVAMPVMSGGLPGSLAHERSQSASAWSSLNLVNNAPHASIVTQIPYEEDAIARLDEYQQQGATSATRSSQLDLPATAVSQSRTASAVTVRNVGSPNGMPEAKEDSMSYGGSQRTGSPPPMTEATSKSESPVSKAPIHGLRRRPGGDLKKNQNVHDLESTLHHQSLDSMLDSSSHAGSLLIMGKPMTADNSPKHQKKSQKVSMINTHSSQNLRPSFEAAVAGFSAIPDDDDGGLEATLLKLEGRYEEKLPNLSHTSTSPTVRSFVASPEQPLSASTDSANHDTLVHQTHRQINNGQAGGMSFLYDEDVDPQAESWQAQQFVHRPKVFGLPTESHTGSDSEGSELSLPILKDTGRTTYRNLRELQNDQSDKDDEVRSSLNINEIGNISRPDTAHTEGARSFLLDEDENISDLSSEISVDIINYSEALGKPISPMLAAPGTAISGLEIPTHPLTHASVVNLSLHTSPNLAGSAGYSQAPPTPQQSPLLLQNANRGTLNIHKQLSPMASDGLPLKSQLTAGPTHIPFILACDSQILAQQLTIVEQSALTEIEWTDLVDMRWDSKSTNVLDWAEYMAKHDDARGIDVVITRFNLVVKWALSEIVLTQDIEERARVLSKLIHVAAHARRLNNYATMLQVTIALMSTSCTRLKQTWSLVPGPDKSLLKHMENLAQPVRNFHDLRVEMESTDLSTGCIPFIGLYVHDLTYNAQKPAEIQIEEGPEPLVNFERFRTAAIIIKGLLRLIDASLRYDFEPIHGIIERCLWMSALTDDRIDTLSRSLEQ
ncbi:Guanine nucleotide exchange factor lte1 [Neophaeococcomyces mojaviensis]|uniref:Guanine nucleotide exchange factor lte1 n=1 Tax=Neophaeococcomyces mojaviensis TaxID=3383035 RepID=A0ACC3AJI8_9EURO|nr:Guanine nucleotide exchange factor lte1 [Knufia sp. JES_112]